ncbi:MAG: hypothetical protein HY913_03890 [Desulfomonile tiedjei]|nr:hypothetical protein [Desulfomonile tiedjei]
MKKLFLLFALLVFVVAGATVLAKGSDKVKCCYPTKSKTLKCKDTTRPECKNVNGRVVQRCEECK